MKEQDLVNQLLEYLTLCGIFAWRSNCGARKIGKSFVRFNSINGVADILGVLPPDGRILVVEAKVKPNKVTVDQQYFLDRIEQAGGLAVVAYSLEDLERALEGLNV